MADLAEHKKELLKSWRGKFWYYWYWPKYFLIRLKLSEEVVRENEALKEEIAKLKVLLDMYTNL